MTGAQPPGGNPAAGCLRRRGSDIIWVSRRAMHVVQAGNVRRLGVEAVVGACGVIGVPEGFDIVDADPMADRFRSGTALGYGEKALGFLDL